MYQRMVDTEECPACGADAQVAGEPEVNAQEMSVSLTVESECGNSATAEFEMLCPRMSWDFESAEEQENL